MTELIHVKGNNVALIEKAEKAERHKEEVTKTKTDFQLQQLGIRSPKVNIHFERTFRKHPEEKKQLKKLKQEHNRIMRLNGFNPKKRMNVTGPQIISSGL